MWAVPCGLRSCRWLMRVQHNSSGEHALPCHLAADDITIRNESSQTIKVMERCAGRW